MKNSQTKEKIITYLALHVVLFVFSISGVLSKSAARLPFLSKKFIILYACMIAILGIYAIAWQQILKRIPIATAYANKAVLTGWTIMWGKLFFHEDITPGKIIGLIIIVIGSVLFTTEKGANDGQQ